MTCTRCSIYDAWLAVRNARTYDTVVDRASEWFQLFWPEARIMQMAPRSLRNIPCPALYISTALGSGTAGQWNGVSIQIGESYYRHEVAREFKLIHREHHSPVRDELRHTILHEVQHAIDDKAAGVKATNDPYTDHNSHFHRRLRKLVRAFPIEGE